MLSKEKIEYFRVKLEGIKKELEEDLSKIGKKNPNVPGDWETVPEELNVMKADKNEMADVFEELENRTAIEEKLEEHLNLVIHALERIEDGTYGKCEECGEPIDEKRLEVFPSAKTCIKHAS